MKKICPRCGRETEKFYDGLCLKCYLETKRILPKTIDIKKCSVCGNYFVGKKSFRSLESAVGFVLSKVFKRYEFEDIGFRVVGNEVIVRIDNYEIKTNLKIKKFVCDSCRKRNKVQAIVQLRGNKKFLDSSSRMILSLVKNSKDKTLSVSKIEEKKEGLDIHVSSKKGIKRIVKLIKSKYDIETKTSRKLVGMYDSRKVYKDKILVREKRGKKEK